MNLRFLKKYVSLAVKEAIMRHYQIPFSKEGLEAGLVNYLKKDKPINLVDVGASTGEFAATIERYCGVRNAVLIEPQPERATELRERFPSPNFYINQCAMSDRETHSEMDIFNWHYSSSLLRLKEDVGGVKNILDLNVRERIHVQVRKLDTVMSRITWANEVINLLKVDVQGGELSVLRGATNTLRRTRLVWTEICFRKIYEGSALFGDIHAFMSNAGFILLGISEGFRGEGGELLEGDALFANRMCIETL